MSIYEFEALRQDGRPQEGIVDASSTEEAISQLRERELFPTSVREKKSRGGRGLRSSGSVERPAGVQAYMRGDHFMIARRWLSKDTLFLFMTCCAAYLTVVILIYYQEPGWLEHTAVVSGIVIVALVLGYSLLLLIFNRTTIAVGASGVSVERGPVPWPDGQWVATDQVDEIAVDEHLQYTKQGIHYTYSVSARGSGGRKTKLLHCGRNPEQAQYICEQIRGSLPSGSTG